MAGLCAALQYFVKEFRLVRPLRILRIWRRVAHRNQWARVHQGNRKREPSMNAVAQEAFSDRMPSKLEIENADQLRTIMAGIIRDDGDTTLNLVQEKGKLESITLTPAIARTFLDVLRLISSGRGFRLIPVDAELTTQQAADLLNVSRPFLIKLLEEQKIPFTKTGRHRRVRAVDLFAYKAERDHRRSEALSDMAALDAAHGLL